MATRSEIIFRKDTNAIHLYAHYDGYPTGMAYKLLHALHLKIDAKGVELAFHSTIAELFVKANAVEFILPDEMGGLDYLYEIKVNGTFYDDTILVYEFLGTDDPVFTHSMNVEDFLTKYLSISATDIATKLEYQEVKEFLQSQRPDSKLE